MRRLITATSVLPFMVSGCFNTSSEQKLNGESGGAPGDKVGEVDISASDQPLAALNLCQSIMPEVPQHLLGKGAGVQPGSVSVATLTTNADSKKSREACEVRARIRQGLVDQQQAAWITCFLETQKGIKAGGKYRLKYTPTASSMNLTQDQPPGFPGDDPTMGGDPMGPGPTGGDPMGPGPTGGDPMGPGPTGGDPAMGGPESDLSIEVSVFLDNADKANFKIYTCESGSLVSKINIQNAVNGGAKGTYKFVSYNDFGDVQIVGSFDRGVSQPGRQQLASQAKAAFKMDKSITDYRSSNLFDLSAEEISSVKVAFEMTSSGDFNNSSRESTAALIGPTLGSALFQRADKVEDTLFPADPTAPTLDPSAVKSETGAIVKTSRGFFDTAGQIMSQHDSDSFKEGGSLHVTEAMLPKLPPADFSVGFEPTDWDCSGAVEVEVDQNNEAYKAYEQKLASTFDDFENCEENEFVSGTPVDLPPLVDQREEFKLPDPIGLPPPTDDGVPPAE